MWWAIALVGLLVLWWKMSRPVPSLRFRKELFAGQWRFALLDKQLEALGSAVTAENLAKVTLPLSMKKRAVVPEGVLCFRGEQEAVETLDLWARVLEAGYDCREEAHRVALARALLVARHTEQKKE